MSGEEVYKNMRSAFKEEFETYSKQFNQFMDSIDGESRHYDNIDGQEQ